jgi:hypothetical protein
MATPKGMEDPDDEVICISLVTVSDGCSEDTVLYSDAEPEDLLVQVSASEEDEIRSKWNFLQHWDHGRCTMVRTWPAASSGQPLEELAKMKPGSAGFLLAVFSEDIVKTELANILLEKLAKTSLKRLASASVQKKPAAKKANSREAQALAVEDQLVVAAPAAVPAAAPAAVPAAAASAVPFATGSGRKLTEWEFQDQSIMKLGLFTHQSYMLMN